MQIAEHVPLAKVVIAHLLRRARRRAPSASARPSGRPGRPARRPRRCDPRPSTPAPANPRAAPATAGRPCRSASTPGSNRPARRDGSTCGRAGGPAPARRPPCATARCGRRRGRRSRGRTPCRAGRAAPAAPSAGHRRSARDRARRQPLSVVPWYLAATSPRAQPSLELLGDLGREIRRLAAPCAGCASSVASPPAAPGR